MKLGAAWYGFREQTAGNYFEMCGALGLQYVEVPMYWHMLEDTRTEYRYRTEKSIDALRSTAEQAGVRIVSSVSSYPISALNTGEEDAMCRSAVDLGISAARRAIHIGGLLGVEVARIAEPNIDPEELDTARARMEEIGTAMRSLGDYAAERNMRIVVENYGLTSEQIKWFLHAADHPAVGTLYDPCNYHRIGEDPLHALKNLGDRVYYCHLKDAFRNDERDPNSLFQGSRWPPSVAVGEGEIEWGPILEELGIHYSGYLCIEYEIARDVMRGMRQSIDYIRRTAGERQVTLQA
jgi:sugar phosphate isomerase/epimerase